MKKIVEVCAGGYQDCLSAYKGGADRVELNSALSVGGLTPSLASLIRVKKETKLNVVCMVRPRAAGFCYDEPEAMIMMEDAKIFLENGADGIAFGFLKADKNADLEKTKAMVDLVHGYQKEAVFHRAFDVCPDPLKTMEGLISCKVDRILTSGQEANAIDGIELIRLLQLKFGDRIQILAGSGINADNAKEIMTKTGIYQVHSSCKNYRTDPTTIGDRVSYSYLQDPHTMDHDVADMELVQRLVNSLSKS